MPTLLPILTWPPKPRPTNPPPMRPAAATSRHTPANPFLKPTPLRPNGPLPWEKGPAAAARPTVPSPGAVARPVSPSPPIARPTPSAAARSPSPFRAPAPVTVPASLPPVATRTVPASTPPLSRPVKPVANSSTSTSPVTTPAPRSDRGNRSAAIATAASLAGTAALDAVVNALVDAGKDAAKDSAQELIVGGVKSLVGEIMGHDGKGEVGDDDGGLEGGGGGGGGELVQSLRAHEKLPISKMVHLVEVVDGVVEVYLATVVVLKKIDAAETGLHEEFLQGTHDTSVLHGGA